MAAYTTIDDPSAHFQIATYTGNGSNGNAVTYNGNSDMQPDLLWFKNRDDVNNHTLLDSSRGVTNFLLTNSNQAEQSLSTLLSSFDTDGFTVNSNDNVNGNAEGIVAWGWKANGGTTSSNTSGTLTSTIQSDTTAGFCIATYTGNGTQGATYGHDLGVAPDIMITKNLTSGSTSWSVDGSIGGLVYGTNRLILDTTAALGADTNNVIGASSTLITVGNGANCNQNTSSHVAYLFAEKQGYSKFGRYYGTNNANGAFVYTGFKPAFVMMKVLSDPNYGWSMMDSKRSTYNQMNHNLYANSNGAESTVQNKIDFLSNGFKLRADSYPANAGGGNNYLYMAFAESPFVTSTGVPTTAR